MRLDLKGVRDALLANPPGLQRTGNRTLELAPTPIPQEVINTVAVFGTEGPIVGTDGQKQMSGTVGGPLAKRTAGMVKRFGDAAKAYVTTPLTTTTLFDWCDWIDGGLVMQPNVPGDELSGMFGRVMVNKKDKIIVPIWDFRGLVNREAATETTFQASLCAPPSLTPYAQSAGACRIEYCFDEAVYGFAVGMHRYSEFREMCRAMRPVSLFGQTYDLSDPDSVAQLDRAKSLIELKYKRTRRMLTLLRTFNATFAANHPELAAAEGDDCSGLLPPAVIDVAPPGEATCETITDLAANTKLIANLIWARLKNIKHVIKNDFSGELRPDDYVFAMNADDALCLMWSQICCNFACPNTSVSISIEPRNLNDAYFQLAEQFTQRLSGGRYGFGYIQMPDGTRLDIWASEYDRGNAVDPLIPAGEGYLWVKSWGGAQPNPYALVFLEENFADYISYFNTLTPVPDRVRLLGVGNAYEVLPLDGCSDKKIYFSIDLLSNAPQFQTKFTGFCPCDNASLGALMPDMPAVGQVVACVDNTP